MATPRREDAPSEANQLWGLIITGVTTFVAIIGLGGTVGNLRIDPIDRRVDTLDADVREIRLTMTPLLTLYAQHKSDEDRFTSFQTQIDGKLSRGVYDVSHEAVVDRIKNLVDTNDRALEEMAHQVHDLESKIVSREENVVHWNAVDALTLRINGLTERKVTP